MLAVPISFILVYWHIIQSNSQVGTLLTSPFDIGPLWSLDQFPKNTSLRFNTYNKNNTVSSSEEWTVEYLTKPSKIRMRNWNGVYYVATIDSTNRTVFFIMENNNLNLLADPDLLALDVVFGVNDNNAYVVSSLENKILRFNFDTLVVDKMWQANSSYTIARFMGDNDVFVSALRDNLNFINFQFFNSDLSPLIAVLYNTSSTSAFRQLSYDNATGTIAVTSTNFVKIWNCSGLKTLMSFTKSDIYSNNSSFSKGMLCNGYYFQAISCGYNVYQYKNKSMNKIEVISLCGSNFLGNMIGFTSCYLSLGKLGAVYESQNKIYSFFIDVTSINFNNYAASQFSVIPINFSSIIGQTITVVDTTNTTNNNTSTTTGPQAGSSKERSFIFQQVNQAIMSAFTSPKVEQANRIGAQIVGVGSSNQITQPIFQPFNVLFEDLWFYGYHSIVYPQFMNYFTKEVDILNELRIKPHFLDYRVHIPRLEEENTKQVRIGLLQARAPDSQLMLQSIKELYTYNLVMCLVSFVFVKLLCSLMKFLKQKHFIFDRIYFFLFPKNHWWSIIICFLEVNISYIAFYSGVQINGFMSFNWFSKVNLTITIILLFVILSYSIMFYQFICRYSNKRSCQKISDLGNCTPYSMWIEATLKCIRPLFMAFIHGTLLNYNRIQLICLCVVDFVIFWWIVQSRTVFKRRWIFGTQLLYLGFMLFLDVTLAVYSFFVTLVQFEEEDRIYFDFVACILIILLILVSFLKFFSRLCHSVKQMTCSKKIQPQKKSMAKDTQEKQNNRKQNGIKILRMSSCDGEYKQNQKMCSNEKTKPFRPNRNK